MSNKERTWKVLRVVGRNFADALELTPTDGTWIRGHLLLSLGRLGDGRIIARNEAIISLAESLEKTGKLDWSELDERATRILRDEFAPEP